MNAEQTGPMPFVAINACLRDDFLQRVISRVLEILPRASEPCVPALSRELASLPVSGFRQFARAPRALQARAAMPRFRSSSEFVGCMLTVWLADQGALATTVEGFLAAREIPRERVRAEGQFRGSWSLDEVLRLTDLFRADHGATDRDDVALLLCCLTSLAPVAAEPTEEKPAATAGTPS